jgi:hypothetical protein
MSAEFLGAGEVGLHETTPRHEWREQTTPDFAARETNRFGAVSGAKVAVANDAALEPGHDRLNLPLDHIVRADDANLFQLGIRSDGERGNGAEHRENLHPSTTLTLKMKVEKIGLKNPQALGST